MSIAPARVATVRTAECTTPDGMCLATALLAASPRVAPTGPESCRVDARGWGRRGGEAALVRSLRQAAAAAGFTQTWVGVADVAVVADAAARLARDREDRRESAVTGPGVAIHVDASIIVASGVGRIFLAPLPLSFLPLPDELREALRALGFRHIGDLAARESGELETRFGPPGVQAHRWARGEDGRAFRSFIAEDLPEASFELEGTADTLEPLLFVLRHLLHRVCADLSHLGRCASRLALELHLDDRTTVRRARVVPARPTRREGLLHDLCRASLERAMGREGFLAAPVRELSLRVEATAAPGARQGDLFAGDWRDPMAAAAALSRLRARLGEEAVAWPRPRAVHRPESRNGWQPVAPVETSEEEKTRSLAFPDAARLGTGEEAWGSILHLLPEPMAVEVRAREGRLVELRDAGGCHPLVVAEGPERISGEWWKDPYRREYYRACTGEGELVWLFREVPAKGGGEEEWWLHGFYD